MSLTLSNNSLTPEERARGRYVPWVIVAFFVTFVVLLSSFAWFAISHKPSEVTKEAYQKGLAYNQVIAEAEKQHALGWQTTLFVKPTSVLLQLRDKESHALNDATVMVWFVRPSDSAMDQHTTLRHADEAGLYAQDLPQALAKGLWEVRLTVQHAGHEFQESHKVVIP